MDLPQGNERQPKAVLQREYRRREGDDFNELRNIIKQLGGSEPAYRHEILSEATRLLKQFRAENASLRQQLSMMSPTPGNGGSSFSPPPRPPPPHHDSAHGMRGGALAASHGFAHTQAPGASSQSHTSNVLITPDSMPEVEQLMRLLDKDFQHFNDNHSYSPYYRN